MLLILSKQPNIPPTCSMQWNSSPDQHGHEGMRPHPTSRALRAAACAQSSKHQGVMQRAVQWLCQVCSYSMGDSVVYKAPSCEGGSSDRGMWLRSLHLV